jgi:hypothetical protein
VTDVMDADPGIEDPGVPAEEPKAPSWFDYFATNYGVISEILLTRGGRTGNNSYNKIDAQQLRLKAAEIAERLTHRQTRFGEEA